MFSVIMLWAASIDGHLSSLVACHCTDLYLFNLFVHLANKLSLSVQLVIRLQHCPQLPKVIIKLVYCGRRPLRHSPIIMGDEVT